MEIEKMTEKTLDEKIVLNISNRMSQHASYFTEMATRDRRMGYKQGIPCLLYYNGRGRGGRNRRIPVFNQVWYHCLPKEQKEELLARIAANCLVHGSMDLADALYKENPGPNGDKIELPRKTFADITEHHLEKGNVKFALEAFERARKRAPKNKIKDVMTNFLKEGRIWPEKNAEEVVKRAMQFDVNPEEIVGYINAFIEADKHQEASDAYDGVDHGRYHIRSRDYSYHDKSPYDVVVNELEGKVMKPSFRNHRREFSLEDNKYLSEEELVEKAVQFFRKGFVKEGIKFYERAAQDLGIDIRENTRTPNYVMKNGELVLESETEVNNVCGVSLIDLRDIALALAERGLDDSSVALHAYIRDDVSKTDILKMTDGRFNEGDLRKSLKNYLVISHEQGIKIIGDISKNYGIMSLARKAYRAIEDKDGLNELSEMYLKGGYLDHHEAVFKEIQGELPKARHWYKLRELFQKDKTAQSKSLAQWCSNKYDRRPDGMSSKDWYEESSSSNNATCGSWDSGSRGGSFMETRGVYEPPNHSFEWHKERLERIKREPNTMYDSPDRPLKAAKF